MSPRLPVLSFRRLPDRALFLAARAGCRMRSRLPWSWSLALAAALLSAGGALPAAASADDKTISRLETKLFQHDYPREAVEARLDRLEKMVFGEAKGGAVQERIHNLLSAVPVSGSDQPASRPGAPAAAAMRWHARAGRAPTRTRAPMAASIRP